MMTKTGLRAVIWTALVSVSMLAGCTGEGSPVSTQVTEIFFVTTTVPDAGAGQFYNEPIVFGTGGVGTALPDRFDLDSGVLPSGVTLINDRGLDVLGNPDPEGTLTGQARLIGFPRQRGTFNFRIKAISTGALGGGLAQTGPDQPDVSASQDFTLVVGEGSINFITPTAAEGTADPAVPAFPAVIDFVNPANPSAFFSFPFLVAGGSGNNILTVYMPRELELSVFDANVVNNIDTLTTDTDETAGSGNKMDVDFSDGGLFVLQAGNGKVQIGGFQSPRGPVLKEEPPGSGTLVPQITSLDPDWFQRTPGQNGPDINSQRFVGDPSFPAGDNTLGTPLPINFSNYFHPRYEGTNPGFTAPVGQPDLKRRKYPFTSAEYVNAFFVAFGPADVTPLKFNVIAEAIDTRGTVSVKTDDIIARKSYVVQVKIPDIKIDTVVLPPGTAGLDYTEVVAASGGVPPLQFDIEAIDGDPSDLFVTVGDPLTQGIFNVEIDRDTGFMFGVPRASGLVEIHVRIFASVMNPQQNGEGFISTMAGEGDGKHPVTGLKGAHRTFQVNFGLPSGPVLANASLNPGVDGQAYPTDTLTGSGGVPNLVPKPVGFGGNANDPTAGGYPASAARTYTWTATYVRDTSYDKFPDAGPGSGNPDPFRSLPKDLVLDGNANSPTNGQISGTTQDRGFHPVTFNQTDFYFGDASAPNASNAQSSVNPRAISVSPDTAIYVRGDQTVGGEKSGLLDASIMQGEPRMVPMFFAASLYTVNTGEQPQRFNPPALPLTMPQKFDILPVMIPNGGSDAHNRKDIQSISGFWPAESARETQWWYRQHRAWMHAQQEMVWIQTTRPDHARVFLFGETRTQKFANGTKTSGGHSKRYQQYVASGKRGVIVMSPLTGAFHVVAMFNNNDATNGTQFGAEMALGAGSTSPTATTPSYGNPGYWKYYYYTVQISAWDRDVQLQGLGSMIENATTASDTSNGWYRKSQGRSATSVAVSSDGLWCATAMPGGDGQKILLWRTDGQPIPGGLLAQGFVQGFDGAHSDGSAFVNSSCIISPGGQTASDGGAGKVIAKNQRFLFPDSLMFVENGLLFLNETQLDHVFGFSLVDGHLSAKNVNSRSAVGSGGLAPSSVLANATKGQFVPDQDYLRGQNGNQYYNVQFSWAGDKPDNGEEGPDSVAFVAGDNRFFQPLFDLSSSPGQPRDGYVTQANRNKSLLYMALNTNFGGNGLDLGQTTVKDLTGSSSASYGDLLTPGREGEEQDWLKVSDDGKFVAVVRDFSQGSERVVSGFGNIGTFHQQSTTGTTWGTSHDLLIISADGTDMDTASGTQHILKFGTNGFGTSSGTSSGNGSSGMSARGHLNGSRRRINGLIFTPDNRALIANYSAESTFTPLYIGGNNSWGINPTGPGTFGFGVQISIRIEFRQNGAAVNFSSPSAWMKNNLSGFTNASGSVGDTSVPFGTTTSSNQMFWATFRSPNGDYLYYIVDGRSGRNNMVGFNISGSDLPEHDKWTPFQPHSNTIGFEQFDVNAFNYENRFAASPAGVVFPASGRDAAGVLFVIASDSSSGATNSTDLEVYVMDVNIGSDMFVLTADITGGSANAINHLYPSADGNFLVGQRAEVAGNSRTSRSTLNGNSDLFVVTNVHAVLDSDGATPPNDFFISEDMSHGSSVAFVGEGTATGPQALVYSSGANGSNTSWDDRTLKIVLLAPGAIPEVIDNTVSFYGVLGGSRVLDDDPATGN